jgi:hypothetical protein
VQGTDLTQVDSASWKIGIAASPASPAVTQNGVKHVARCVISGFRRGANKVFAVPQCYAVLDGSRWRFETSYRSHLQEPNSPRKIPGTLWCVVIEGMAWAVIGSHKMKRANWINGSWSARSGGKGTAARVTAETLKKWKWARKEKEGQHSFPRGGVRRGRWNQSGLRNVGNWLPINTV